MWSTALWRLLPLPHWPVLPLCWNILDQHLQAKHHHFLCKVMSYHQPLQPTQNTNRKFGCPQPCWAKLKTRTALRLQIQPALKTAMQDVFFMYLSCFEVKDVLQIQDSYFCFRNWCQELMAMSTSQNKVPAPVPRLCTQHHLPATTTALKTPRYSWNHVSLSPSTPCDKVSWQNSSSPGPLVQPHNKPQFRRKAICCKDAPMQLRQLLTKWLTVHQPDDSRGLLHCCCHCALLFWEQYLKVDSMWQRIRRHRCCFVTAVTNQNCRFAVRCKATEGGSSTYSQSGWSTGRMAERIGHSMLQTSSI